MLDSVLQSKIFFFQVKVWFQNRRIKWRKQNMHQQVHKQKLRASQMLASDRSSDNHKLIISEDMLQQSKLEQLRSRQQRLAGLQVSFSNLENSLEI